jgi:hypothetical protein
LHRKQTPSHHHHHRMRHHLHPPPPILEDVSTLARLGSLATSLSQKAWTCGFIVIHGAVPQPYTNTVGCRSARSASLFFAGQKKSSCRTIVRRGHRVDSRLLSCDACITHSSHDNLLQATVIRPKSLNGHA